MGYNFTCVADCTLDNAHIGPCDALSDEEKMATSILGVRYKFTGFCTFCGMVPGYHADDCVTRIAARIWDRREASLQYLGRQP